jgi:hypothetical protein
LLKSYLSFLIEMESETRKEMIKEKLMRMLNANITSASRVSQAIFIEMNILGTYRILDGHYTNLHVPDKCENLSIFLHELLGFESFNSKSNTVIAGAGNDAQDNGRYTRSVAPFVKQNPKHQYDPNWFQGISSPMRDILEKAKSGEWDATEKLLAPFVKRMSNVVGPVHSITSRTIKKFIELVELNQESVLIECGCGPPFVALVASLFAKLVIGLDLPSVIEPVLNIISHMDRDSNLFAKSIHLISGQLTSSYMLDFMIVDILEMTKWSLPEGVDLNEVTHISAFIGIPSGIFLIH